MIDNPLETESKKHEDLHPKGFMTYVDLYCRCPSKFTATIILSERDGPVLGFIALFKFLLPISRSIYQQIPEVNLGKGLEQFIQTLDYHRV